MRPRFLSESTPVFLCLIINDWLGPVWLWGDLTGSWVVVVEPGEA